MLLLNCFVWRKSTLTIRTARMGGCNRLKQYERSHA